MGYDPHDDYEEIATRRAAIWAKRARWYKDEDRELKIGAVVSIVVTDPWEFADENEGRVAFIGEITENANGYWVVRLARPIVYQREAWNFCIPSPRHEGQRTFDDNDQSANMLLITDEQANSTEFRSRYDAQSKPETPWVIGTFQAGFYGKIREGEDSYVEPTWKAKGRAP